VTLAPPEDDDGQLRTGHGMRPPFDSSRQSRSRPRARNFDRACPAGRHRAPARPLKEPWVRADRPLEDDRYRTHSATRLPDARSRAPRPATMPTRPRRTRETSPTRS
jgi:hypothetical protein